MSSGARYTVFAKDAFLFGVSIDHVREVIHGADLIPAPVLSPGFLGFFDFRRRLCPVFDIPSLLGRGDAVPGAGPRNLIVWEWGTVVAAFWIDRYVESLELEEDPSPDAGEPADRPFVDRMFRYKGQGLGRLNLAHLGRHIEEDLGGLLARSSGTPAAGSGAAGQDEAELLCFTIDRLQFAIPIADLVEVIEGYSVEPLFRTNSFLRGLINLRGQILACVDLSEVIGVPRRKMEERNQYLLLQDNDRDLALCIDTITKKQKFPRSLIQEPASLQNEELGDYLGGVIEDGGNRILVLSGPRILASKYLEPYQE